ncbi:Glutathione S-transferase U8 [Linum grandiflorum]
METAEGGKSVKVLGFWASPYSRRVELALKLKGVDYDYFENDFFKGGDKTDLLVKSNPVNQTVPVLIHNGKAISESTVILEYIEEEWPDKPIFPLDRHNKALARFWAAFAQDKCFKEVSEIAYCKDKEEKEKLIQKARENLKTLEEQLKGNPFFGGEKIGIVDITASFVGYWLGVMEEAIGVELVSKERFPELCKWIDNFVGNSKVKEILPPRNELLAALKPRLNAPCWKYVL